MVDFFLQCHGWIRPLWLSLQHPGKNPLFVKETIMGNCLTTCLIIICLLNLRCHYCNSSMMDIKYSTTFSIWNCKMFNHNRKGKWCWRAYRFKKRYFLLVGIILNTSKISDAFYLVYSIVYITLLLYPQWHSLGYTQNAEVSLLFILFTSMYFHTILKT